MLPSSVRTPIDRRTLLGTAGAGALAGLGGCLRGLRNVFRQPPDNHLSLRVASVSGDVDPQAVALARALESALEVAGIEVDREVLDRESFYRTILITHEFDLFVGRLPPASDPEALYEALHSRFADEWGWQNPYGFTNITFDNRLERQRDRTDAERRRAVAELLRSFANEQPFTPICRPTEQRLVDTDRFTGWGQQPLTERTSLLSLQSETAGTLRAIGTDEWPTRNLNPLAVATHSYRLLTELLYDSLATYEDGRLTPWLADDWSWTDDVAQLHLREATWHDGEPVTADDVIFTYDFLSDTSMDDSDVPSPAPVYRGQASAIENVDRLDGRRVRIRAAGGPAAAENAFRIPILPEHVWRDRTEPAQFQVGDTAEAATEAIVSANLPPIGSGLFEFDERTDGQSLKLTRNESHFTRSADDLTGTQVDRFELSIRPDTDAAIEAMATGEPDLTLAPLDPTRLSSADLPAPIMRLQTTSRQTYCLGFNVRSAPLTNPYFRRTIAQLLDKAHLAETVFAGAASPIASPLGEPWIPESLVWDDGDPVTPFLGSDGELEASTVRAAFEGLGYRYNDDGELLART